MVAKAVALMVLAVGLAAPAAADSTDDAFLTNLNTSGMDSDPQTRQSKSRKPSCAARCTTIPMPATRT